MIVKTCLILCGILYINSGYAESFLKATPFPKTFDDLSFKDRIDVLQKGYEPFVNMKAYQGLNIVPGEEHYTERELARAYLEQENDKKSLNIKEYCEKYPDDIDNCPNSHDAKIDNTGVSTNVSTSAGSYTGYTIGGGPVIENNIVVGQSCYPAAKDKNFKNKILTTGKYERISPAFEKGLITVFRKEGECGIIKNDPCGYTCYGIGSKCNNIDVSKLTRADAEDIYYKNYWGKYNINLLPDVISTDVFLAGMASGPQTAINQFREFLGLPRKGKIDNSVIQAVNNYNGNIHQKWLDKRDAFLQAVAKKRYNGSVSTGYKNAIELKRKNGCHVRPEEPLYR